MGLSRDEFRIGTDRLERRRCALTLKGWTPSAGAHRVIESNGDLSGAITTLLRHSPSPFLSRKPTLEVDDSLLQFAMVPSLKDARTVAEFRKAIELRCTALFGWSTDRWFVGTDFRPSAEQVLVCGCRREDLDQWRQTSTRIGASPGLAPTAVRALNEVRDDVPDNALAVVLSATGCVAIALRSSFPVAVAQERNLDCASWQRNDVTRWLRLQAALDERLDGLAATMILDVRDWGRVRGRWMQ
jgi:hypothetical protein